MEPARHHPSRPVRRAPSRPAGRASLLTAASPGGRADKVDRTSARSGSADVPDGRAAPGCMYDPSRGWYMRRMMNQVPSAGQPVRLLALPRGCRLDVEVIPPSASLATPGVRVHGSRTMGCPAPPQSRQESLTPPHTTVRSDHATRASRRDRCMDRSIRSTKRLLDRLRLLGSGYLGVPAPVLPRPRQARDGRKCHALPPSDPPATAALSWHEGWDCVLRLMWPSGT